MLNVEHKFVKILNLRLMLTVKKLNQAVHQMEQIVLKEMLVKLQINMDVSNQIIMINVNGLKVHQLVFLKHVQLHQQLTIMLLNHNVKDIFHHVQLKMVKDV
jgi:hypothetical protein